MRDYAFYTAGCENVRGLGRILVPFRRLLRRLLRPMLYRQVQLYEAMDGDIANAVLRMDHIEGFHYDTGAMARRLALLEDRVEALMKQQDRHPGRGGEASGIRQAG